MYAKTSPDDRIWAELAAERQKTSQCVGAALPAVKPFERNTESWVKSWLDLAHRVTDDKGRTQAIRAMTDDGQLFWFVRSEQKDRGFHAGADCPFEAIAEARHAWARRREIRQVWDRVLDIRRDILTGRRSIETRIEDAYAAPLSPLAIEGFLRSVGLQDVTRLPGRSLAMLWLFDEDVGFALWEAAKRTGMVDAVVAQEAPTVV